MNISFFFPAYMDERTVEPLALLGKEVLSQLCDEWEIIIVHDASPDRTGEAADRVAATDPRIRVIHHAVNKGYGGALWTGITAAKHEWIFFTDGDMQFDVRELPRLTALADRYDIIVGYKTVRADPWYRLAISKCYNLAVRVIFGLPIRDINCAFKLMRREVFAGMKLSREYREAYLLVEAFYRAVRKDSRIAEVPVSHFERQHGVSQSFNLKASLRFLWFPIKAGWEARVRGRWG